MFSFETFGDVGAKAIWNSVCLWYNFSFCINYLYRFRKCFEFREVRSDNISSNLQMFEEMVDLEYSKSEKYENIRVFTAALESSTVPLYDLKSVMEKWSRPSPGKNFMRDYVCIGCWSYCCSIDLLIILSVPLGASSLRTNIRFQ